MRCWRTHHLGRPFQTSTTRQFANAVQDFQKLFSSFLSLPTYNGFFRVTAHVLQYCFGLRSFSAIGWLFFQVRRKNPERGRADLSHCSALPLTLSDPAQMVGKYCGTGWPHPFRYSPTSSPAALPFRESMQREKTGLRTQVTIWYLEPKWLRYLVRRPRRSHRFLLPVCRPTLRTVAKPSPKFQNRTSFPSF